MNKVARTLLVSLLIISVQTAIAQESLDLAPTMKAMGMQMKVLGRALIGKEPTPKEELDIAAKNLAELITVAMTKAPLQLIDEKGVLRADAKAELEQFDRALEMLLLEVKSLQAALAKNDLEMAATILKDKIVPLQRSGHEQFRKD